MPTTADRERFYEQEPKLFRAELKDVRAMVIDYRKQDSSFEAMKLIIKVVTNIDALDKSLEALAFYIRHEDTRADDRDREMEIHHARYGF